MSESKLPRRQAYQSALAGLALVLVIAAGVFVGIVLAVAVLA